MTNLEYLGYLPYKKTNTLSTKFRLEPIEVLSQYLQVTCKNIASIVIANSQSLNKEGDQVIDWIGMFKQQIHLEM